MYIKLEDALDVVRNYFSTKIDELPTKDSPDGEIITGDYNSLLKHNKEIRNLLRKLPTYPKTEDFEGAVTSIQASHVTLKE